LKRASAFFNLRFLRVGIAAVASVMVMPARPVSVAVLDFFGVPARTSTTFTSNFSGMPARG